MSYKFFQNTSCNYFPCHRIDKHSIDKFNCLFCYCPLYREKDCKGNFTILPNGIKDCSNCLIPHCNYDYIVQKLKEINKNSDN